MTYSEKLKDPRWQRKRLEVMSRDNFTCVSCRSTDKTLHVHHQLYINDGRDPWEYHNLLLVTLCYECHEKEEREKERTTEYIEYFLSNSVLRADLHTLLLALVCRVNNDGYDLCSDPAVVKARVGRLIEHVKKFTDITPQDNAEAVH